MTIPIGGFVRLTRVHTTHAPLIRALLGRLGVVRAHALKPVERYAVEFRLRAEAGAPTWGPVVWVGPRYLERSE
jgi:hypothetical protein